MIEGDDSSPWAARRVIRIPTAVTGAVALLTAAVLGAQPLLPGAPDDAPIEESRPRIDGGQRPAWAPKGEWIAYDRADDLGFSRLWVSRPDGTEARCLTCRPLEFRKLHAGNATWHPSGEILIFQVEQPARSAGRPLPFRTVPGGNRGGEDLWAIGFDGRDFWNLTNRGGEGSRFAAPHFSREGDRLVWSERVGAGGGAWGRWVLRVARFERSRGIPRLRKVEEYEPGPELLYKEACGFTADDRGVLFSGNLEPGQLESGMDLYELRLEDGTIRRLTRSLEELDRFARFSPNGRWIAWVSSRDIPAGRDDERYARRGSPAWRPSDLWLMAADGSGVARLTRFSDFLSDRYQGRMMAGPPAWSPEGDRLLVPIAPVEDPTRGSLWEIRFTTPLGR